MTGPNQERLLEVAALLSQDAATILVGLEPSSQIYILRAVTIAIDHWEKAGVQLDPVQFDIVVTSLVAAVAPPIRQLTAALTLLEAKDSSCEHSQS